ncbi:hypothetical protein [Imhoffiella purpurea]|uniref:Uncharacterized protein n=1 Tax=Imhoffiella purpurea TaxID=1249627 RepID=W9VEB6_9GAMM|nr:hypothetical protein [Imhoffiella purpurea]EXJ14377.1 hypothetical protein D779_2710 [Imhoffiella purpurea]
MPDLDPPTQPLHPEFPREVTDTSVVIFTGDRGLLRVDWSLHANDFIKFAPAFPLDAGTAIPVVRLHRVEGDGRMALADQRRIMFPGIGGEGRTAFDLGGNHGRFQVELGFVNDSGGWLSLARSNTLQSASSLGLPFSGASTGSCGGAWADSEGQARSGSFVSPGSEPLGASDRVQVGPALAQTETQAGIPSSGPDGGQGEAGGPGLASGSAPRVDVQLPESGGGGSAPSSERNETEDAVSIPRLVYGKPAFGGTRLMVQAELRIQGWAPPNSEIDLFGHRYVVGPGGRFQFLVKVDDPDLLRQALDLHPPPELSYRREN